MAAESQPPIDTTSREFRRTEGGWNEVSKGLKRLLLGQVILVSCGISYLVLVLASGIEPDFEMRNAVAVDWRSVTITLVALALDIIGSGGYLLALSGVWKCMLAPERKGAKWLIFVSFFCLVLAPICFGGLIIADAIDRTIMNPQAREVLANAGIESTAQLITIIGASVSLTSILLFVLFLRAIGASFQNKVLTWSTDVYLFFVAFVIAGTVLNARDPRQASILSPSDLRQDAEAAMSGGSSASLALLVAVGWLLAFLWYLSIIAIASRTARSGWLAIGKKPS